MLPNTNEWLRPGPGQRELLADELEDALDLVGPNGFAEVIQCAQVQGLDGGLDRRVSCQHDH